jgi:hypothetical protein
VTRRPVRGLAPIEAAPAPQRPPGPATILGPDGRTWTRDADGLYYDEHRREVFSQAALRDLIERADERLQRAISSASPDPVLVAIANAKTPERLHAIYSVNRVHWTDVHTVHARGRRAVLELPPKEAS